MDEATARILDSQVAGCASAHQRLLAALDDALTRSADAPGALNDRSVREPSLLPGWSRAHVLAHLVCNAESHVRMFEAATRGLESEQYVGGKSTRDRDIEEGAKKDARSLVAGVRTSIYLLESAWAAASDTTWGGFGIKSHSGGARVPIHELVLMRWCETEVHHADLNLGFTFDDWTPLYVRYDLDRQTMAWRARKPMGLTVLPEMIMSLPPSARLAWFYGRIHVDGVVSPEAY